MFQYLRKVSVVTVSSPTTSGVLCAVMLVLGSKVAAVTFSDSDSAPVPKFLNLGPAVFANLRIRLVFRLRLNSSVQP